jgi:uncharacterized membrane protein YfcA
MTFVELSALSAITLMAATVNGALGYGFSSLTVPLTLLFLTSRVLNPALVLIEVPLNAYVLFVNRRSIPAVWRAVVPMLIGLAPGVLVGTTLVAVVNPSWMKLWTFAALLPLILLQAAGYRRPLAWRTSLGLAFGGGLGVLYSVTTISGPPLAMALNNQGYSKREFRAALGLVRLSESTMTAAVYLAAGLFTSTSVDLALRIVPSLLIGVPLGTLLMRKLRTETFGRICMSFDAWVVAFGLASLLALMGLLGSGAATGLFAVIAAFDGWLLYRYFRSRGRVRGDDRVQVPAA